VKKATFSWGVLLCCLLMVSWAAAQDDGAPPDDPTNIHLCGTGANPTLCGNSNAIIPTSNHLPTITLDQNGATGLSGNGQTGTVWMVVFVPNSAVGGNSLVFTANGHTATNKGTQTAGHRFDLLGFTVGNTQNSSLNAPLSFTSGVIGSTNGYYVYLVNAGTWSNISTTSFTINFAGITGFPTGTVIWAFLTDVNGSTAQDSSPWSESLGISGGGGNVPEPASLTLLGTGLLGLAGIIRRSSAKR